MPRCPNCNYILVLLQHRMKYKCAKCGKLFLQKQIEDKEFQKYNEQQRQLDNENFKKELESRKRPRLTAEEKKQKLEENQQEYREKNREKLREQNRARDRKEDQKIWYHKNPDRLRSHGRLKYWRQKQKMLTLQMLENKQDGAYNLDIFSSPPTKSLSYLIK